MRADRPIPNWQPVPRPQRVNLEGRFVRLEPLDVSVHADTLHPALHDGGDPKLWDYLRVGPFPDRQEFDAGLIALAADDAENFYAVVDLATGDAVGFLAFLRIDEENGSIEIGWIAFGARMQRTPMSTEAVYLLAKHAFDLGYRRLEWKCNSANERSRRAAVRFGFTYEGTFRNHQVSKGRNRDTDWFSIIEEEWPPLEQAFERWLSPDNFDGDGNQRSSLRRA
jgi:RimJ/RimL family protein N-acetyltransferase